MADLYCSRCGEPWEMDYVNFEMTPLERVHFKDGKGCPSCFGKEVLRTAVPRSSCSRPE